MPKPRHWYLPSAFAAAARAKLVDIFQPDIHWVGGLTAIAKICAIAEAAGISVIPHGGGITAYGQHACYALPAIPWAECFVATPPGVPPEEAVRIPGIATPKNGRMVPSNRPGFGIEITEEHLAPFVY